MKKRRPSARVPVDEILPHYDLRGSRPSPYIDRERGLVVCSSLLLDGDVADWFRMRSPNPEAYINAVLRLYMEEHRHADEAPPSPKKRAPRATALKRDVRRGTKRLERGEGVPGAEVSRRLRGTLRGINTRVPREKDRVL